MWRFSGRGTHSEWVFRSVGSGDVDNVSSGRACEQKKSSPPFNLPTPIFWCSVVSVGGGVGAHWADNQAASGAVSPTSPRSPTGRVTPPLSVSHRMHFRAITQLPLAKSGQRSEATAAGGASTPAGGVRGGWPSLPSTRYRPGSPSSNPHAAISLISPPTAASTIRAQFRPGDPACSRQVRQGQDGSRQVIEPARALLTRKRRPAASLLLRVESPESVGAP